MIKRGRWTDNRRKGQTLYGKYRSNEEQVYFDKNLYEPVETTLKNPLNIFSAYFEFTQKCHIPETLPCPKCLAKNKKRCSCSMLAKFLGRTPSYIIEEIQETKNDLNTSRSCLDTLNIEEWKAHTSRTLVTNKVVPTIRRLSAGEGKSAPEMVTNAWCKLYEILRGCQVISPLTVWSRSPPILHTGGVIFVSNCIHLQYTLAHLCECPGAFICAVNHYLQTDAEMKSSTRTESPILDWKAVSLNPYFEGNDLNAMIDDDVFYRQTYSSWLKGEDDSGNIKNVQNILHFTHAFIRRAQPSSHESQNEQKEYCLADLVTADGSVDSQYDANAQESITASLHLAEFVTALKLLAQKGNLVLKLFTLFEHHTLSILALASCLFENILVVKPVMSRAGSGETYFVAKNFLGLSSALSAELTHFIAKGSNDACCLFPKEWIPHGFLKEFCNASKLFAERQRLAVKSNLSSFHSSELKSLDASVAADRIACIKRVLKVLAINPIPIHLKLVSKIHLSGAQNNSCRKQPRMRVGGVQNDRFEFKESFDAFQVLRVEEYKKYNKQTGFFTLPFLCPETFQILHATTVSLPPIETTLSKMSCPKTLTKSELMMQRMNHIPGQGLGKQNQGTVEPLELQRKTNLRGLHSSFDARRVSLSFSIHCLPKNSDILTVLTKIKHYLTVYTLKREKKIYQTGCTLINTDSLKSEEWITWGTSLLPCYLKISHFLEENLLTKLQRKRVEFLSHTVILPVLNSNDIFLCKTNHSLRQKNQKEHVHYSILPTSSCLDLIFLLRDTYDYSKDLLNHCQVEAQQNTRHYLRLLFQKEFQNQHVLEISNNGFNVTLASLFEPLGIKTRLVISEHTLQELLNSNNSKDTIASAATLLKNHFSKEFQIKDPFQFIRPFYWKSILSDHLVSDAILALTFRQYLQEPPNRLVYINPYKTFSSGTCRIEKEYSYNELTTCLPLLAFIILGLACVAHHGYLILPLYSVTTRFTATLILLLSFHFETVKTYRPPSTSAWTALRYIIFQNAIYPSYNENNKSPIVEYLMWCWDATITKSSPTAIMELLPPLCYTDETFQRWITNWNNTLAEEELEDFVYHLNDKQNSLLEKDALFYACKQFLQDHLLLGFCDKDSLVEKEMCIPPCLMKQKSSSHAKAEGSQTTTCDNVSFPSEVADYGTETLPSHETLPCVDSTMCTQTKWIPSSISHAEAIFSCLPITM